MRFVLGETTLGVMLVAADDDGLTHIAFQDGTAPIEPGEDWQEVDDDPALNEVLEQLGQYFASERQAFDFALPLNPGGTAFQQQVWDLLQQVPYGRTTTYGDLAKQLGKPVSAARAVGAANGANPLPVVIPCHRVVSLGGKLTGYRGGVDLKRRLLAVESRQLGLFTAGLPF